MPIHCAFRGDVLVLTYVGDFTTQESIDAVENAMAGPGFRSGMAILFDMRAAPASALSSEELARRVEWAVALASRGFRPQFASVITPSRERLVQSGVRLIDGRVALGLFETPEEALAWLATPSDAVPKTCWVCRRTRSWVTPMHLTAEEREACDECRPPVTNLREALTALPPNPAAGTK
jgi:hypothetical protein